MNSFIIKIIAMITMLIDHSIKASESRSVLMYALGRIAFPLFAFQTTIGYEKTRSVKKYLIRLLVFAIISQISFSLYNIIIIGSNGFELNVIFTMILGIISMYIYDIKIEPKIRISQKVLTNIIKFILIANILMLAQLIKVDYKAYGVFLILFIHIFYNHKNKIWFIIGYILLVIAKFTISYYGTVPVQYYIGLLIGGLLPLIIMLLYNGKKGKSLKYLFYVFYPVHLAIIVLIKLLISI